MEYIVAKYLRISAEDIDLDGFDKFESNSIVNQRTLLDDFIGRVPEFTGCEVIEALDDGRTGTNFLRPGVQKLIEMAQSGKVHCIVVKDLSRWGRNYLEVGDFLEQKFPAWGVRFISLNDCYDSAKLMNGATGGIDIAFRNLIYDLYSQDLSEKVKSAKISAAKSGKYTNGLSFFGYIKDPADPRKLIIDEKTVDVVRRIFDLTAQGHTPNRIAKALNDERVPTAQDRKVELGEKRRWRLDDGSFWYGAVVANIVRDERYTGKLIYGKSRSAEIGSTGKQKRVPKEEWIVVPGAIPAIVTEEQYRIANRYIRERGKHNVKTSPSKLLFTRKLKCGHCGLCMKAVHRTSDVKYRCFTQSLTEKLGCGDFWVFEKDIAAAVLAALRQQIAFADNTRRMLTERTEQLTPGIEKLQTEAARLQKRIEKTKTAKMGLWEKFHNGSISAEAFQRENEQADDRIVKHTARIPEIQAEILRLESETGRENLFVERFSKQAGITELTKDVVDEFIKEVRVYSPERIEVIFSYADEYERIAAITDAITKKKRRKQK